jgi:hypothetical protein
VAVTACLAQYPSLSNVEQNYIDKLGNNGAERFRSVGARAGTRRLQHGQQSRRC